MSIAVVPDPDDWQASAACKHHPNLSWFPRPPDRGPRQQAICATCPVKARCLEDGRHEPEGIWGGVWRHRKPAGDPKQGGPRPGTLAERIWWALDDRQWHDRDALVQELARDAGVAFGRASNAMSVQLRYGRVVQERLADGTLMVRWAL